MKKITKLNLIVIMGASSLEHEISIISGVQAIANLDKSKYNIYPIYITKSNHLSYKNKYCDLTVFKNITHDIKQNCNFVRKGNHTYLKFNNFLRPLIKIDAALVIVHGAGSEDGTISSLMEFYKIPYTSSTILSSSVAQDKIISKELLKVINIPVLDYTRVDKDTLLEDKLTYPVIIKPVTLGSSIGINVASNFEELKAGIKKSLKCDSTLIIEPKLKNFTEYNCAIYKCGKEYKVSQIEEVKSTSEYLTFDDKYSDENKEKNKRIIPANISLELENQIKNFTKMVYDYLDFKGVIRIDYLYDLDNLKLYLNEINTIPGSLAFYLYEGLNIKYSALLDDLIKDAIITFEQKNMYLNRFKTNILANKKLNTKK